jgi:hypothetical protein
MTVRFLDHLLNRPGHLGRFLPIPLDDFVSTLLELVQDVISTGEPPAYTSQRFGNLA